MAINFFSAKPGSKRVKSKILIVCEGAKTEPAYFRAFRISKDVQTFEIKGVGRNTLSLVKYAKDLADRDTYKEVWCVFDKDSFTKKSVNDAFALAEKHGFNVAFSNEAFELWYVLHYHYLDTKITRKQYCDKLSEYMGAEYKKNDDSMYAILFNKRDDAVRNAKKLERAFHVPGGSPYDAQPTTSVYKLVEKLIKLELAVK